MERGDGVALLKQEVTVLRAQIEWLKKQLFGAGKSEKLDQAQRHGHDPHAYLKDVLTRLPAMTNQDDLRPLLPSRWKAPKPSQAQGTPPEHTAVEVATASSRS